MNLFTYSVKKIDKIVDGDTIYVTVDLGFFIYHQLKVRLNMVDAPEIYSGTAEEKEKGQLAKSLVYAYVKEIEENFEISVKTKKTDKYGRWVGTFFYMHDGMLVNMNEEINKLISTI